MPKSTSAGSVMSPGGRRPADHRRQRAGHRADQRGERRARLERRVDEHVADDVSPPRPPQLRRCPERQLHETGRGQQHAEPGAFGDAEPARAAAAGRCVRRISRSVSRSQTWFSAAAPPATSAVPTSVCAASASAHAVRRGEIQPGERRDEDEQIQPRLGERDEVQRATRSGRAASSIGRRRPTRPSTMCVLVFMRDLVRAESVGRVPFWGPGARVVLVATRRRRRRSARGARAASAPATSPAPTRR